RVSTTQTGAPGVFVYTWTVQHNGATVPHTQEAADGSQIGFIAATAGPYYVTLDVAGPTSCDHDSATLNVSAPGASLADFRMRVTPPSGTNAPPQETIVQIKGGADYDRSITLDPGIVTNGSVKNGAVGIPAYVRFMPASAPLAVVEAYAGAAGTF